MIMLKKMMTKFNTLIFDFDYTLADSSEAVIECVNYALRSMGLPPQSEYEIKKTIGKSLPDTFASFCGHDCARTAAEFRKYFREKADEVMTKKTRIFEYVPEVIRLLHESHYRLAIVSTKFHYRIDSILERENIAEFFDIIVGGEDVSLNKPHPEGLLKALELLHAEKKKTLYIGDSVVDAQTGESAGVAFLAVLSGVTGKEPFAAYSHVGIISDLREIDGFLKLLV